MRRNLGPVYTAPVALWIGAFFVVPITIVVLYSFLSKGVNGGVVWHPSLEAYAALANPVFLKVARSTLAIALTATLATLCLALPSAYYMARSRHKHFWLFLIIIPFWTNFLIRIYAWMAILGNNGLLNNALIHLGLLTEHVQFLYNPWAVILVLVYTYLPYAILPLYATIEKFDFALLEAAADLGATRAQAIRRVLIPNVKAGLSTAILFTFIPAFGNYAVPQIVGGTSSMMLGNIIARELTVTRNWPLSASISVVLTGLTTLGVLALLRANRSASERLREQRSAAGEAR